MGQYFVIWLGYAFSLPLTPAPPLAGGSAPPAPPATPPVVAFVHSQFGGLESVSPGSCAPRGWGFGGHPGQGARFGTNNGGTLKVGKKK